MDRSQNVVADADTSTEEATTEEEDATEDEGAEEEAVVDANLEGETEFDMGSILEMLDINIEKYYGDC